MDRREEAELIALVRRTPKAEILPRFRRLGPGATRVKGAPDDLVTDADLAAEGEISEGITRLMPDALMVGEEAATADPSILGGIATTERAVILDPVDGTWNFANGVAVFGVIIAVAERGRTVWGLLYDPIMDDWVVGRAGGGAWFGRQGEAETRLQAASTARLAEATGHLPHSMFSETVRRDLTLASLKARRISQLRCSCHEYRLVAQGRTDFILTGALFPWDHAAGALVVQEAGGRAAMIDGRPYGPHLVEGHMLSAANADLHGALRDAFAPALGLAV